jgi:ankyrin repeat protein
MVTFLESVRLHVGKNSLLLHRALMRGHISMVVDLLKNSDRMQLANWLKASDSNDMTILHLAVLVGTPDLVYQLIRAGSEINAINETGLTPLHLAAAYSAPEIVQHLLDFGANLALIDLENRTPYFFAEQRQNQKILNLMQKYYLKQAAA